jgi:hypothetical protein
VPLTVSIDRYNDEEMVTLNMHCHAPTCLSMSVWACPNGTALTDCANATSAEEAKARGYELLCEENPVYGGSGCESKKPPLWSHFNTKKIVSPRQARDKHKETLKSDAICAGTRT